MQVTMLTTQSQTIKKLIVDRSFLWMVSPAQRLIAKVTVVIEMFAKRKLLLGAAFTWRKVCVRLFLLPVDMAASWTLWVDGLGKTDVNLTAF